MACKWAHFWACAGGQPVGSPGDRWNTPEAVPPTRPQATPGMTPLGLYTPTNSYTRNQLLAVFRELKSLRQLGLPHGLSPPKFGLCAAVRRPCIASSACVVICMSQPMTDDATQAKHVNLESGLCLLQHFLCISQLFCLSVRPKQSNIAYVADHPLFSGQAARACRNSAGQKLGPRGSKRSAQASLHPCIIWHGEHKTITYTDHVLHARMT